MKPVWGRKNSGAVRLVVGKPGFHRQEAGWGTLDSVQQTIRSGIQIFNSSHSIKTKLRNPPLSTDWTDRTRSDARRSDSDSIPTDEYTAIARSRIGTRPQMMICFRKCSGEVTVFAYSLLTKIRSENPDRGFTLTLNDTEVRIEGENCSPSSTTPANTAP